MSRIDCPDDVTELPDFDYEARRADIERDAGPRRRFLHTPVTHDQLASTINRALADAEIASLAAAETAHSRGGIAQREVAPGIWQLTRGRAA